MPQFAYRIARADGTILEDRTEADDEVTLRQQLEGKGYLVFSIQKAAGFSLPQIQLNFKSALTPREFLVFNQELLALIKAGLPIIRVLDILVDRAELAPFREALRGIRQDIKGGFSIADAMSKYPQQFPELYVSSLRAGERSGNMAEIIERYNQYQKRMIAVWKKVRAALNYPIFLLAVSMGVVVFLLVYVMPTFSEIYRESDAAIPVPTKILLNLVQLLRANFIWIILALAAGGILLRSWSRTAVGRVSLQRIFLRLPLVGAVMVKSYLIQITRTLSAILSGGIPLVTALEMVADALTNRTISAKIREAKERVKEGISLASALEKTGFMPRLTLEMVSVGEATGALEQLLMDAAEFHEEELDILLGRLTTWVEPLLLLFMGTIVAAIVIIMYLPVFNLAGTIR
jgi:type IV pilus assembly protein PilC